MDPRRRRHVLTIAGLGSLVLLLLACRLLLGPSAEDLAAIRQVAQDEGTLILDVRSPEEFTDGHLAGAVNIPVGELKDRLGEVGAKDRPLVVY